MRILIVEDEPVIAMNLEELLLELGHQPVGPVGTIHQARAFAEDDSIEAAILDVTLPDGSSADLARQLMEKNVAVLFSTGLRRDRLVDLPSAIPVIEKPYSIDELEKALKELSERAADHKSYLSGLSKLPGCHRPD